MTMTGFTPEPTESIDRTAIVLPALTVEVALYAAIASGAFFIRFFLLGNMSLDPNEARQALASWNFVRGLAETFTGSPLLFTGNALLFALFGATDAAARCLPALFGSALVLTPALLRNHIGRGGALIASALFAFSPSLVLFSREANGAVIAMTCSLAAFAFAWRYLDARAPRDLYVAAAALALALLAAREVWTFVLAALVFLVLARLRREEWSVASADARRAALVFALVFIGVSTAFLLHRDGFGAAFDLFGAWLNGLALGGSPFDPLRLLVLYEPVALFFGAVALVDVVFLARETQWSDSPLVALALWAVIALGIYTLGADKAPARVVAIVVPLTLLAAWFIGAWLDGWVAAIRAAPVAKQLLLTQETPVLFLAFALAGFLSLVIAEFALRGGVAIGDVLAADLGVASDAAGAFSLAVVAALIVVAALAIAFLGVTTLGAARTRTIGVVFVLIVLGVWTFRQSMLLNFTLAPNVREWLQPSAAAPNLHDLVADIKDASRWRANDTYSLVIAVDESLGAQPAWYLRDFRAARLVSHPTAESGVQALLLPGDAPGPAGWIGQRYELELLRGADRSNLLRWLIYRDVGSVETRDAVLWLPKPEQ
jgi:uncharacterized protein (TIGR03663 family)